MKLLYLFLTLYLISCTNGSSADSKVISSNNSTKNEVDPDTPSSAIIQKMLSQVAQCRINYVSDSAGMKSMLLYGMGFIVDGEYFVTCFHVYKSKPALKVESIIISYNMNYVTSAEDTVAIDLGYKPTKNQYNFYKHKLDMEDVTTDFVILKLAHAVNQKNIVFNNRYLQYNDRLYTFGMEATGRHMNFYMSKFINAYTRDCKKGSIDVAEYVGTIRAGTSGCPVFNDSGEVVGMSVFGYDKADYFFGKKEMTDSMKLVIRGKYDDGYQCSVAADLAYYFNRYGKGYIGK